MGILDEVPYLPHLASAAFLARSALSLGVSLAEEDLPPLAETVLSLDLEVLSKGMKGA